MRLHDLKPIAGSTRPSKRVGCGESSGHGKTSGRGHKGQKARSGGSVKLGFEGGQMPLYRRLPKRGFNNVAFKTKYAIVNLDDLNDFEEGSVVDEAALRSSHLIRGTYDAVKVLGRGEFSRKLTVEADVFSDSARQKIESAGGTVTVRERKPEGELGPDGKPVKIGKSAKKRAAAKATVSSKKAAKA